MRAVTIVDGGKVEVREHVDPEPGAGEVLVRVRAASLNAADLLQVAGFYPPPPGVPKDIPGLDLAGEVVALGPGATRFSPGDRVMAVVAGGGQAELAVVHERELLPVPEALSWEEAGGFPEVFTTAHDAVFTQCGLQLGERLCVHGAAGGVGTAAVQLGVAAGASVVATVRNVDRHDAIAALGAEVVVPDDFVERGPFDVVLELVGGSNFTANLDALAMGGRISIIGVRGGGSKSELDLLKLMQKRARVHGSTLRARPLEQKADAARRIERQVLPLVERGAVKVLVAQTFGLDDAVAAYEAFAAGGKLGKLVLAL